MATIFDNNNATLSSITMISSLYKAWRKVRANRGAAGVDAVSLEIFERDLKENLQELSRNLIDGTYEPLPVRCVLMKKSNGKERELAILTVRDRIAQRAVLDSIEPLFERLFLDCNFAFRPGRNIEMAVQRLIVARANGAAWVVRSDIKDFFPSLDRRILLKEVAVRVEDKDILQLVKLWLKAEAGAVVNHSSNLIAKGKEAIANAQLWARDGIDQTLDGMVAERLGVINGADSYDEDVEDTDVSDESLIESEPRKGLRKAAVRRVIEAGVTMAIAERHLLMRLLPLPLLAIGGAAATTVYFAPSVLRKIKERQSQTKGMLQGSPLSPLLANIYLHPFDREMVTASKLRLIRYCDDFAIACKTKKEAEGALNTARETLSKLKLNLNEEKTRIHNPREAFDFLGYHFADDGRVVPPPNVPQVVTQKIVSLSHSYANRVAANTKAVTMLTTTGAKSIVNLAAHKLNNLGKKFKKKG